MNLRHHLFATVLFATAILATDAFADGDDGFKPIFNGKDLTGWDGNPKFWSVQDGTITGQTTKENPTRGNTFLIWRQGDVDDFEIKLEYKMIGGNSGIQYRSWEEPDKWGRWVIGGYQADMDAGNGFTGILYGERYRNILANRGQQTVIGDDHKPKVTATFAKSDELKSFIKSEDWNDYYVVAKGYTFTHTINGHKMSECTDEDHAARRRTGLLALQLHAGPPMKVQFRNVRLKRLKLEDKKTMGVQAAARDAGPVLLEPVMQVEVITPDDFMGEVMGNLSARRGRVAGMEARGSAQAISAEVPLSTMFGYSTDVRSMTQGRATYTMQFARYAPVPAHVTESIVERMRGA